MVVFRVAPRGCQGQQDTLPRTTSSCLSARTERLNESRFQAAASGCSIFLPSQINGRNLALRPSKSSSDALAR